MAESTILIASGAALGAIIYLFVMLARGDATGRAQGVARQITSGTRRVLTRISLFVLISTLGLTITYYLVFNLGTGITFLLGSILSLSGFCITTILSTKSQINIATDKTSLSRTLKKTALFTGAAVGTLAPATSLISIGIIYSVTESSTISLISFALGTVMSAFLIRLSGSIFTKAADIGADLAGKRELHLQEDDARNPAVEADTIGDSIGGSIAVTEIFSIGALPLIVAIAAVRQETVSGMQETNTLFLFFAVSIIMTGAFAFLMAWRRKVTRTTVPMLAVLFIAIALIVLIASKDVQLSSVILQNKLPHLLALALGGLVMILLATHHKTSEKFSPVRGLASLASIGSGTNLISGLALSLNAPGIPLAILLSMFLAGSALVGPVAMPIITLFIAITAGLMTMLTLRASILDASTSFAHMSAENEKAVTEVDAATRETWSMKPLMNAFIFSLSLLTSLGLFILTSSAHKKTGDLTNPETVVAMIAGGLIMYIFSAATLNAVARSAGKTQTNTQKAFRKETGEGEGDAHTKQTKEKLMRNLISSAITQSILPAGAFIATTLLVALLAPSHVTQAVWIGAITTSALLSFSMSMSGAAFAQAKRYIEAGNHGGTASQAHAASLIGDAIGDAYKDAAGPLMSTALALLSLTITLIAMS